MDPILSALLQSWDWRVEIVLVLVLAGIVYLTGWQRLRTREHSRVRLATGWRLATYLSGLVLIGVALMSPIDILGGQFFFMHMIQHLLLVMLAPPLLLIANPFPFILWGLPAAIRPRATGLFKPTSTFRHSLRSVTSPGLVWIAFVAVFLGWHDPNAYNAALQNDGVHDLEHLTFFITAMLFWWHVIQTGPRLHGRFSPGARLAYLLIIVPINMLTGVAIAFAAQPIYTYYTAVPRLWGITVMQDQLWGGLIMWIPGSMMYLIAVLVLISGMVNSEGNRQPESKWAAGNAMLVPNWKK